MSNTNLTHIDFHAFIRSLSKTIDAKDAYTSNHSERVAQLSQFLAKKLTLPHDDVELIHFAAHLHDIGKIGIPDGILLKTGKLNTAEFEVIKQHPVIGAGILSNTEGLQEIASIILYHHERIDGKGYPAGLAGENIPLGSRIIAVADSLDAMITMRTYKHALTIDEAIRELTNNVNKQFDPQVVEALLDILQSGELDLLDFINVRK